MNDIEYTSPLDEFEHCVDHTGCWKYLGFYSVGGWPVSVHYSMRHMADTLDVDREAELRYEIGCVLAQIVAHEGWAGRVFANHTGSRTWRAVPTVGCWRTIN